METISVLEKFPPLEIFYIIYLFCLQRKTGKYGFAPKFSRMKILHELLVYILYQYEGDENLDQEERKAYLQPLMESVEELPKCYVKEIGWKMFIPPLLKYEGKVLFLGSSTETVAFQVYEILKINHKFLQFF